MVFSAKTACFLGLILLASCAPVKDGEQEHTQDGKTIEEMRAESLAKIDHDACMAEGGEVRQEGMLGLWRCVTPYADAGEICSDRSDCEGRCLGSDDVTDYNAPPGEAAGRCEADDSPFGCYAEINAGAVTATLCVD